MTRELSPHSNLSSLLRILGLCNTRLFPLNSNPPTNDSLESSAPGASSGMFYFVNILSWYQIYSVIACCGGQGWGLDWHSYNHVERCWSGLTTAMSAERSNTDKLFGNVYPPKLVLDKSYYSPTSHTSKQRISHSCPVLVRQHFYSSKLIILVHNYCSTARTLAGNTNN